MMVRIGKIPWEITCPMKSKDKFGMTPLSYAWEAGSQCSVFEKNEIAIKPIQK